WLMMSLWDALRMNMMISYQELVRTFHSYSVAKTWHIFCLNRKINNAIDAPFTTHLLWLSIS
ncbi:hypothetical protein, partial [Escherichia coli]|uniref:hypothetical protein n=1 Tax=Escherichia coli TaxID=562 RepID=UPI000F0B5146